MQTQNRLLLCSVLSLLVGGAALGLSLVDEVEAQSPTASPPEASAPDIGLVPATPAPAKVSTDAPKGPGVAGTPAPDKSGVDSQNARKMRDRLRNQFAESEPKELAETARERGSEARAKFRFGRLIAVRRAREVRMTEQRLELRKQAEQMAQERAKVRAELDKEIEQTRQQFAADKEQCDRQLTELIISYRPRLQQLKDDAARATQLADRTDARLSEVRRDILSLEQQTRLMVQGRPTKPARALIADLDHEDKDDAYRLQATNKAPAKAVASPTSSTKPGQTVEQLLEELD